MLPAPVFRATVDLQARRRLGLTATLVREDGREVGDVFALIGPKHFDVPWKDLERQAWIASATCVEERVPMSAERRMDYALADRRSQFRIAAENPAKMGRLRRLLEQYRDGRVLIIRVVFLTMFFSRAQAQAATALSLFVWRGSIDSVNGFTYPLCRYEEVNHENSRPEVGQ